MSDVRVQLKPGDRVCWRMYAGGLGVGTVSRIDENGRVYVDMPRGYTHGGIRKKRVDTVWFDAGEAHRLVKEQPDE